MIEQQHIHMRLAKLFNNWNVCLLCENFMIEKKIYKNYIEWNLSKPN